MKKVFLWLCFFAVAFGFCQEKDSSYKKRVLENTEIDILFSYYDQDGNHAAVSGGEGTEKLSDAVSSIIVKMPLNEDAVLTIDAGISAYTSASSSNVNPLDGNPNVRVDPFVASSGASRSDELVHLKGVYEHSSDDRNTIWNASAYFATEYDYFSIGFGGGVTKLFNERNTEISANIQVYLDKWNPQYPIELRSNFADNRVTGTGVYNPSFVEFTDENRNSYSLSLGLSQILSKRLQGSLFLDIAQQKGLLSNPFQRVYFGDVNDFFIEDFQLADDIERLPNSRFKFPIGGRLNYYLSDVFVLRGYYRFYNDNWGVSSHTASLEVPVKLNDKFTLYPTYRYYSQSKADYFYEKEVALSSLAFYTADYDLSKFVAHQYGVGVRYKDIFAKTQILGFGLKALDIRGGFYDRSDGLNSFIVSFGATFVAEK